MLSSSSARTLIGRKRLFRRIATTWQLVTTRRHLSSSATSSTAATTSSSSSNSRGFLAWYSGLLDTHPLMTKTLTSGLIAGTGDFLCQWLIRDNGDDDVDNEDSKEKKENGVSDEFHWDKARTGRFGFLGFALVAPCIHFWYEALNRWLPGTKAVMIAKRVFLDQFVYTPIFLPVWLVSLWSLERLEANHSEIDNKVDHVSYVHRLAESLPDIIMANWSLWIPVMTLNFRFVPLKYQVLTSNIVALLWNCYLSFSTSRSRKALAEEVSEKKN